MRSVRGAAVLVVVAVLAAIGFVVFADGGDGGDTGTPAAQNSSPGPGQGSSGPPGSSDRPAVPIGDGSTSDTGPQPNQPAVEKLKPGEKPPQFVVFSWDGAAEMDGVNLVSRFRKVARETNSYMTLFLSGIYVLPESKKALYQGPKHGPGATDISFIYDKNIRLTLGQLREAWLEGDEVGTHFNGHFCNSPKSGETWSVEDWKKEIDQAYSFVQNWRTNTGWTDVPSLPFDYKKELIGGRAPCLEGQKNLIKAAKEYGWRYDASSKGGNQVWPRKIDGIWDLPLQSLPWPGSSGTQLSMDFNIMYEQTGGKSDVPQAQWPALEKQATDFYVGGFERAYTTNRAPLFIGNHFETWNGGVYMNAVENTMRQVCVKQEVRCVSFRQFVDWLDAQDPGVVANLQGLGVGQAPANWATVTGGSGAPKAPADTAPHMVPAVYRD
ncbi:MAG TPA: hypothetical protein VLH10_13780 [Yinghuangia sp.]|uniref:hypothetical protein n=1 Tax=Yinghuangia sp. YIM S10712 TaxID=3436930 RepID=UPI002D0E1508|nr:hypothetical protein [Yinghuangia sp.]